MILLRLRHPILSFLVWRAPRVRGTKDNPLNMRDLDRLHRLLQVTHFGRRDA